MELPDVAGLTSSLAGAALRGADAASDDKEGACAICLDAVDEVDVALVKQCLHAFCTPCIVRWTTFQHDAARRLGTVGRNGAPDTHSTCPCCKARFDSLLVYRDLDGEVSADLREESVCLLRRARWLPATRKDMAWENDHAISAALESFGDFAPDGSAYHDDDLDAYADEEERYMSGRRSGDFRGRNKNAGRDRSRPVVVLGNRRFGANGQIAQGHRMFARPVGDKTARHAEGKGAADAAGSSSSPDAGKARAGKAADRKGKTPAAAAEARLSVPGGSSGAAPVDGAFPPGTPDGRDRAAAGAARGKKAAKRAEAKAKKEEKEAARRARRAETVAASVARAKATRSNRGEGGEGGEGVSELPDLPDVEDTVGEGEADEEDASGPVEGEPASASAPPAAPAAPAAPARG